MISLRDKFFGCIAGAHIGSAMGAQVEGSDWKDVEKKYGLLDHFEPYHHYGALNDWMREPGTTEDGVERQKLMITAIMRKGDRITAEDLRSVWASDMNPRAPGMISEPFEGELLALAKTVLPARDIGRCCDYAGLVSFARSCHPLGLINAGDIAGAITDVLEVGQLYQTSNSRGLQWACVTAIAIAEAAKPGATVESVIGAILDNCAISATTSWGVKEELERGLTATQHSKDVRELRVVLDTMYNGIGMPYHTSFANEVVTKAVCIFRMVRGNLREAVIAGVNMGRDTDCMTAVAAGISGALTGNTSVPEDWVKQVDYAASINPYTNRRDTLRQYADGLYEAFTKRLQKMRDYAVAMGY
ncbi:MAG: ADP-ribosylglycohydrolase family protein [Chitinivibrionales bacterium]|nr:ADP-ribosylglycohydrolase family protein [Chitinivibrionales bacterium]